MLIRILTGILLILTVLAPISAHGIFSDTRDHWADDHIFWATFDYPVFSGYPDGTFRPENSITRAEYLTMINKLLALANDPYQQKTTERISYRDLYENHWAYSHIQAAHQSIEGATHNDISLTEVFSGPLFEPEKRISRYEAALASHAILSPETDQRDSQLNNLWDLDESDPNSQYIQELETRGIISGFPDGSFRPEAPITRAEAAALSRKIFEDLEYLKENFLTPIPLIEMDFSGYPVFSMATMDESTDNHRRFIDAVTSLEYISIVGFIPYEERALYDPNPIETLWELKEGGYQNELGISYYLIKYDDSLSQQEKRELANDAINAYLLLPVEQVDGMSAFFKITKDISNPDLFQQGAERYLEAVSDEEKMLRTINLLAEHYQRQNLWDSAENIYHKAIRQTNEVGIIKNAMQNLAYTSLQHRSTEDTIQLMNDLRMSILDATTTSGDWEALHFKLEAIQKQLLLQ